MRLFKKIPNGKNKKSEGATETGNVIMMFWRYFGVGKIGSGPA